MEAMRKVSKEYYIRQIIACYMVCLMTFGIPLQVVMANPAPGNTDIPTPGDLGAGNTAVLDWTGSDLTNSTNPSAIIGTATGNNVIGWNNFDIGSNASVTFTQGGGWILNNINPTDTSATGIFGSLLAPNGAGVIVQNPYGVVFGPQSLVQAKSFVATGLLMNISDFIAQGALFDPLNFEYGGPGGDITTLNGARIEVDETLALIGKNIFNKGNIVTKAEDSYVVMTAGDNIVISRVNSHVNVNVSSGGSEQNWVKNEGSLNTDDALGKTSLVLAAGDIYSTAIGGVESLRATAVYGAEFDGAITVSATAASDAVAEVDISTGSDLTIDHDITADATGDGVFDASASIKIASGEDIKIKNDGGSATEVKATAHDGANNSASVEIEAEDNVILKATQQHVKVEAQADSAAGLNQADVSIKGKNVIIETGHSSSTEVVKASARDADENIANVNIEADGGVLLKAGINNQIAIVKAEAINGSINRAGVTINAGGGVDIIANESDARVLALAYNEEGPAVLNEAKIDIKAGSLTVRSESNHDQAEIRASAWNGTTNTAEVAVETEGDVLVTTEPGKSDMAGIEASAHDGVDNFAGVDIKAGGDVKVKDYKKGFESDGDGEAYIKAVAVNSENSNTAQVDIEAGGSVVVLAKNGGIAKIESYAGNSLSSENTANINILAEDGYVLVHAIGGADNGGFTPSRASIEATAENAGEGTNNASINIVARDIEPVVLDTDSDEDSDLDSDKDGSVLVIGVEGGKAEIEAIAKNGGDNSASVDIDAENDVKVMALCDNQPSQAEITALAKDADNSNTANVTIVAGEDVKVIAKNGGKAEIEAIAKDAQVILVDDDDDTDADLDFDLDSDLDDDGVVNTATVVIAAGDDVLVHGIDGDASIEAKAENATDNTATIGITTGGDVKVIDIGEGGDNTSKIEAIAMEGYTNTADVTIFTDGDVVVKAKDGGEATIKAVTVKGFSNDSDVLICAEGEVVVEGVKKGEALIKAIAHFGHLNDAYVGVSAGEGVSVLASHGGEASIASKALFGFDNDAFTQICTDGGVLVVGEMGGDASILAEAKEGVENDAFVAVCAVDDIIVAAGFNPEDFGKIGTGGSATIKAEAEAKWQENEVWNDKTEEWEIIQSFANATTTVVSHDGGVAVVDIAGEGQPKTALIEAEAHNAWSNTADVGVAAGGDLLNEDHPFYEFTEGLGVLVLALGEGSRAGIVASAHDGEENTANVVVCAPGLVAVVSEGARRNPPAARIRSIAGDEEDGELNTASTQIYAGDVFVSRGARIAAVADGDNKFVGGNEAWSLGDPMPDWEEGFGDGATLIIDTYENRQDCPTCPPCPDCGDEPPVPPNPPAPLYTEAGEPLEPFEFDQGGCPALMQWFANEVGLAEDQIFVMLGNADYLATDIQPCEACARLMQQADAMAGLDAAQLEAWASAVRGGMAGPITPEMIDGIRTALADNPAAMGFDDAAAEYARILNEELGFERDDAVAIVTSNYAPDYADLGAYISARTGM